MNEERLNQFFHFPRQQIKQKNPKCSELADDFYP